MRQPNFPEVTVVWREPDRLPAAYIRAWFVAGSPPLALLIRFPCL